VVAGWLLPRLRSLPRVVPAVKTRPGPTTIATNSQPARRLQQAAAVLVGLGVLSAVVFSGNLPLVTLLRAALAQDEVGVVAAPIGQEFRAVGAATVGVGDLEATLAVLAAMGNDRSAASGSLAQAVWWAPQSVEVERTRAWLLACREGGRGLRPPLTVLAGKQDRAGTEQALGLWAERSGQPSRQHFFAALEADPTVSTVMPDGVPAAGPTGSSSERAALIGALKDNQELMGSAVAWSVQHGSYTQAVALDDIAEGFYRNAPGPTMKPTYHHLVAAATAYAHLGSSDEAAQSLRAAFGEAPANGDRQDVAAAALLLAVRTTPGASAYDAVPPGGPALPLDSTDPLARFAATRGNAADHLALALFSMSRNQQALADRQLRAVLDSNPDRVTRARALAALAVHDYVTGDYASAKADAGRSLDLHVPETRAVADSVLGNTILATEDPGSPFRAPSPEAETRLRASVEADPDAFMLWYALAQLDSQRHDYSSALHDDLKALSAYQLVTSGGLGSYQSVIGPEQESGSGTGSAAKTRFSSTRWTRTSAGSRPRGRADDGSSLRLAPPSPLAPAAPGWSALARRDPGGAIGPGDRGSAGPSRHWAAHDALLQQGGRTLDGDLDESPLRRRDPGCRGRQQPERRGPGEGGWTTTDPQLRGRWGQACTAGARLSHSDASPGHTAGDD
jgi:tetratricopeptide (TPR) repeat protein